MDYTNVNFKSPFYNQSLLNFTLATYFIDKKLFIHMLCVVIPLVTWQEKILLMCIKYTPPHYSHYSTHLTVYSVQGL